MKTQTITIVGLGREGGSIGLALKESSLEITVTGYDRDGRVRQEAEKSGVIDNGFRSLRKAASNADILILTVSVLDLEETLQIVGDVVKDHALILDLSGGKAAGLKWAESHMQRGHYVGGILVPSAANLTDGRSGLAAASADAYKDSVFCVMPAPMAEPRAIETAVNLGLVLGATPFYMDGAEYDTLVQGVETIPTLLAAAMFGAVQKTAGWRDILRFAGLPFAQSTQPLLLGQEAAHLAMENKEATLRWFDALLEQMSQVRRWISEGEAELLAALLEELDIERQRWLDRRAENSWIEITTPNVRQPSFSQQMLGGLARGPDSDK